MTAGPRQMLADMRLNNKVLKLRREALEIARSIIADQHPEYDAMQLEAAACDLCDAQVQEANETQPEGESK
jgi:hypothetical protein